MQSIVKIIEPAITTIVRGDENGNPQAIHGAGFIIREDGVILTCAHVIKEVEGRGEIMIGYGTSRGKESYTNCSLLDIDENHDIALLKANLKNKISPVELGTSSQNVEGLEVIFAGFPLINNEVRPLPFYNKAMISTILTHIADDGITKFDAYILDTLARAGYSGGPLLSVETGKVVGIIKGSLKEVNQSQEKIGIPMAFPIDYAKKRLSSI